MRLKVVVVDLEVPPHVKKRALRIGVLVVVLTAAAAALAVPISFSDGQTLTAADLNTDFSSLQSQVDALIPSGAVVAFNLGSCPSGWSNYSAAGGRTIIGVNPDGGNELSQRNLGEELGEEAHTMSLAEMPSHSHAYSYDTSTLNSGIDGLSSSYAVNVTIASANSTTATAGQGAAFNQMQPSIALLYCQKN